MSGRAFFTFTDRSRGPLFTGTGSEFPGLAPGDIVTLTYNGAEGFMSGEAKYEVDCRNRHDRRLAQREMRCQKKKGEGA